MNDLLSFSIITVIAFSMPLIVFKFGKQFLTGLLPIYLIIGNVFAMSFIKIGGQFQTSLSVPIYSATFLISAILSEHYGKEEAKKAVWIGFMGQIILVIMMLLITHTTILSEKTNIAYNEVFKTLPRLIVGSFVAYLISQFIDVFLYNLIKNKWEFPLWFRNNVSTITAQLIDTTVIIYIAFWKVEPFTNHSIIWNFILTTWVIKIIVAIFDTPFLYVTKLISKSK